MRRVILIVLIALVVLLAAGAGIGWYLLHDEAFLKSRLSGALREHAGRELRIDGRLRVDPGRRTTVEANDIHVSNAAWAEPSDMVRIGHLKVVVDIPSLFTDVTVIPEFEVADCRIALAENDSGETNWADFAGGSKPADAEPERPTHLPIHLLDNRITRCSLEHRSPQRQAPLQLDADLLELRLLEGQRWQGSGAGKVNGESLSLSGWMEPSGAILLGQPAEFELDFQVGQVKLHSKGRFADASTGAGADLDLRFTGPELARPLAYLGLPPLSDGPFDFRLSLDRRDQLTHLQVRGDLGRMQANAEGRLDQLVQPTRGEIRATLHGPDLEALGQAFGLDGLLREAYDLKTVAAFEPGKVRIDALNLAVADDNLVVKGILGTGKRLAESDLAVTFRIAEIGHWAPLWGRPPGPVGEASLDGAFSSDAAGLFAFTGGLKVGANTLTLTGPLGSLSGDWRSDVNFDLHADGPQAVAALAGLQGVPDIPLTARGRLGFAERRLQLHAVDLALGRHRARVEGTVNTARPFTGSQLNFELDSPDAADLGNLLGRDHLPASPVTASGHVSVPDRRFHLQNMDVKLADHRLRASGYLVPGEPYVTAEALDVRLTSPDIADLARVFGAPDLPPEPIDLAVNLEREGTGVRFSARQALTTELRLEASGVVPDLTRPLLLDADFDIGLPRLELLSFLAPGFPWPALPAGARGTLRNLEDRTVLENVSARLGSTSGELSGEIQPDGRFAFDVSAQGPSAQEIAEWLKISLPPDAFSIGTRLTHEAATLEFADLDATLGGNAVAGDLRISLGDSKSLSAVLQSPSLDLTYWMVTESAAGQADAAAPTTTTFVFDDTPVRQTFNTRSWSLDFDVRVAQARVGNGLFDDVRIGFRHDAERLEVDPFSLAGARGGLSQGHLRIDYGQERAELNLELHSRNIRSGIGSAPGQDPATIPSSDLDIMLHGTGATRRELASNLDGEVRLYSGAGKIAQSGLELLFTDFLSQLFQQLNPFAEKSEYTELECVVAAAEIRAGQMSVSPVVVNTRELTILSQGTIDLRTEKIDLSFNTKPRTGLGITTGVLINPLIKVGGSLATPAIEFDPKSAIVSGGTAVATAGLSILAKGFADRFLSSKDPCGDARKEIAERQQP